jgi:hypothetical protein
MTTRRRHWPLAAATAAIALAVLLALVARDLRRWEESVVAGDQRFQISPARNGLWEPDGWTPTGDLAVSLLGLDDDLRLREAAQLSRRSRPRSRELRTPKMLAYATSAQVGFGQVQQSGAPARLRSVAANELGVLALAEMVTDPTQARDHARRATEKFVEAIRLDTGNVAAHHNLELILTLRQQGRGALEFEDGEGPGSSTGAGSGQGGSGF